MLSGADSKCLMYHVGQITYGKHRHSAASLNRISCIQANAVNAQGYFSCGPNPAETNANGVSRLIYSGFKVKSHTFYVASTNAGRRLCDF